MKVAPAAHPHESHLFGLYQRQRCGILFPTNPGGVSLAVSYELRGPVAVITINRPERRNAVDGATARALGEAWRRFDAEDDALVAILQGAGGHFSAGADLKSFDLHDHPDGYLGFTRTTVSKPTIAAIEGSCVAGGLEMALWCDLRVSGRSATFGCLERRFGIPLVDGGTQRLPRIVGQGIAMEMILTGRLVDAEEAHAIGLVNIVAPDGEAFDTSGRLAMMIARYPQQTVRSDRLALLEGVDLPLEQGLEVERSLGNEVLGVAARGAKAVADDAGRSGRTPPVSPAGMQAGPGETEPAVAEISEGAAAWAEEAASDLPSSEPPDREETAAVAAAMLQGEQVDEQDLEEPLGFRKVSAEGVAVGSADPSGAGTQPSPPVEDEVISVDPAFAETPDEVSATLASPQPLDVNGREGALIKERSGLTMYVRNPPSGRGWAVLVIHDRWGLDESTLDMADRVAELGHVAIAPDLFGGQRAEDKDQAAKLLAELDPPQAGALLSAAVGSVNRQPSVEGDGVAVLGAGVGGGMALWLTTIEGRILSCVAFNPVIPWPDVSPVYRHARCAFLGHQSRSDDWSNPNSSYQLEMRLRDLGRDATFHLYRHAEGGFFDLRSSDYRPDLAELAWERTRLFLARTL